MIHPRFIFGNRSSENIKRKHSAARSDYEAMQKDREALSNDWIHVGDDIRYAIKKFEEENGKTE